MADFLEFLVPWHVSWPILAACAAAVALYVCGLTRSRAAGERVGFWKPLAFLLGVGLMYAVTQTHLDYYSQFLFFAHRAQHLVLHHLGPFLVALSAPAPVLARGLPMAVRESWPRARPYAAPLRVIYRALQQPVIAAVLFVGLIYFWLTPSIHFDAMLSLDLYWIMNWSMALDGLLFWWLILGRGPDGITPRLSYGKRILILALIVPPQILLGAYIALSGRELFGIYAVCGRPFPISPMVDQQIGGLITWIPASMMSVIAAVILLGFMTREQGRDDEAVTAVGGAHAPSSPHS